MYLSGSSPSLYICMMCGWSHGPLKLRPVCGRDGFDKAYKQTKDEHNSKKWVGKDPTAVYAILYIICDNGTNITERGDHINRPRAKTLAVPRGL